MNKLVLFCVESTPQADTDTLYIQETLEHFYVRSSKITIRFVHMKSKTRYNSKTVREEIKRRSMYFEDITVIYCVDTDDYDISSDSNELLNKIREHCESNNYEFIFFCKDIEDVYWGQKVQKTKKISEASRFRSSKSIEKVNEKLLQRGQYQAHCSNILNVLDRYFTRKH